MSTASQPPPVAGPPFRARETQGRAEEVWHVERDGAHICNIELTHYYASGLVKYRVGLSQEPSIWKPVQHEGTFKHEGPWDRAGSRAVLASLLGADVILTDAPASARLDFTDPEAVRAWLHGLRVSFKDLDAAASDMLEPPRRRRLGHELHAEQYHAAADQIRQALDYADPDPEPSEPSDPAGNPGHMG